MSKNKGEAAVNGAVYKYLYSQNRPYSANDIVQNLHKEHGKTAVQKALDQLVQDGKIKEKVYGKQKVYVVDQSVFPDVNEAELKEMDNDIEKLTSQLKEETSDVKTAETRLKELNSSLTTSEAKKELSRITTEVERLLIKLQGLSENRVAVSAEEKKQVHDEHAKYVGEWRKRKRLCMDMVNSIMEGYPQSQQQLFETVGIETDEDVGVKLPK